MEAEHPEQNEPKLRASVHACPQCGFSINLKDLGLRVGATGLVTCPKCEWSGPVEIQIVDKESTG
jgi:predicted RNA-binding Zn-ribbon protein involved in translation (DUF1610 family)